MMPYIQMYGGLNLHNVYFFYFNRLFKIFAYYFSLNKVQYKIVGSLFYRTEFQIYFRLEIDGKQSQIY